MTRNINWNAPLPLGYISAIGRAWELRSSHITNDKGTEVVPSWTAVALIMREYHGFERSPSWWRDELRRRGLSKPDLRSAGNFTRKTEPGGLHGYLAGAWNGPGGH